MRLSPQIDRDDHRSPQAGHKILGHLRFWENLWLPYQAISCPVFFETIELEEGEELILNRNRLVILIRENRIPTQSRRTLSRTDAFKWETAQGPTSILVILLWFSLLWWCVFIVGSNYLSLLHASSVIWSGETTIHSSFPLLKNKQVLLRMNYHVATTTTAAGKLLYGYVTHCFSTGSLRLHAIMPRGAINCCCYPPPYVSESSDYLPFATSPPSQLSSTHKSDIYSATTIWMIARWKSLHCAQPIFH